MPGRLDPSVMAEKFRRRVSGAGPDYEAGVAAPRRDWQEGYEAASDRMKAELQRALSEGRHLEGAREAGTAKWQKRARELGAQRYQQAASAAAEEYAKKASDIAAAAEAAISAAQRMPDTSIEQRLERATAAMRAVHEYWQGR